VKKRVKNIAGDLAAQISQWDDVEAILLGEAAEMDTYDPFFTIDIDVYIQGVIPSAEERRNRFDEVEAYETTTSPAVDRFVVQDLPVTLHFMQTEAVDAIMRRIIDSSWVFHESGTNPFYRIEWGEVLYSRGGWLASIRAARAEIPTSFWDHVCLRSYAAAERALADMGAAAFRADPLYFQIAAARMLRGVAAFLFGSNRQFEPSGRMLSERIKALPALPERFLDRLDSFLDPRNGLSAEGRREVAEVIVQSLIQQAAPPSAPRQKAEADKHAAEGKRSRRKVGESSR
jgi:hypothetical protein